jgi:hypothetical protein
MASPRRYCARLVRFQKQFVIATPENTAVVTIMAYADDSKVPATCNFMLASAKRVGIKPHIFLRGEDYIFPEPDLDPHYEYKINRLRPHLERLPYHYDFILFFDARDVLFVKPLEAICDDFNSLRFPIVHSADTHCYPHLDTGWHSRFSKTSTGFNYLNSGLWMGERDAIMRAFCKLDELRELVKDDMIQSSFPRAHHNDQHVWQTAYLEQSFPMRLDFTQIVFNSGHRTPLTDYDFYLSTPETPIVLRNGSRPGIVHFAGQASIVLPYFAWLMNIVPAPTIPPLEYPEA